MLSGGVIVWLAAFMHNLGYFWLAAWMARWL